MLIKIRWPNISTTTYIDFNYPNIDLSDCAYIRKTLNFNFRKTSINTSISP